MQHESPKKVNKSIDFTFIFCFSFYAFHFSRYDFLLRNFEIIRTHRNFDKQIDKLRPNSLSFICIFSSDPAIFGRLIISTLSIQHISKKSLSKFAHICCCCRVKRVRLLIGVEQTHTCFEYQPNSYPSKSTNFQFLADGRLPPTRILQRHIESLRLVGGWKLATKTKHELTAADLRKGQEEHQRHLR